MTQSGREKTKSLTNEELAKAALELVDQEGVDALSFRKLCERTGVPTMTIMNRFGSKRELMKAALGVMLDETVVEPLPNETWQESLRRVARMNRAMALRHPKAFMMFVLVPIFESPVLEFTDRVFSTHENQNLPPEMPSVFLSLMHSFLPGFQLAEAYANEERSRMRENADFEATEQFDLFTEETFDRNVEIIITGLTVQYGLPEE
ncbi:TetR/AcrR family transcriptional regulator [Raoultibacter phocaeensis]|uniref:TetR/AcrR family transcriptional regulator n=1 Tax=Raoultibacter phocaeensis TaxID=2479841 RepID=UPI001118E9FF|nr:TetR family transcriptional regulator [Raoultibacter phocaeensis]